MQAFRGLTNQGHDIDRGMSFRELHAHMLEAFEKMMKDGVLEHDEIEKMCKLVMYGLDKTQDGQIEGYEYMAACATSEVLQMSDVVAFFDDERKKGCLEWLFDDTNVERPEDYDPERIAKEYQRKLSAGYVEQPKTLTEEALEALDTFVAI